MPSLTDTVCRIETEYPETDTIQIVPVRFGFLIAWEAITLDCKKPKEVNAWRFWDESLSNRRKTELLIFKNYHNTGAALDPFNFIKYVATVVKPENGKVATFGKLPKPGDFFRRNCGLGFLLSRKYSSRPLVRIPQSYQSALEENAPALVTEMHGTEGRTNKHRRDKQHLEADLVAGSLAHINVMSSSSM